MKLRTLFMVAVLFAWGWLYESSVHAHPPTGIVVDRSGNVYFSDLETIWKFSADGNLTVFRAGMRGRHVHELAIDKADNVYGADVSYNPATKGWLTSVWKMKPDGTISYLHEPSETSPQGISIWLDADGNMYSVDQNNHTKTQTLILRRTTAGQVTTLAGSSYGHADGKGTAAQFGSIGGMAFGPDGSLYLSDGPAVRQVTMQGDVRTVVNGLNYRDPKDRPRFLAGSANSLTGLSVAPDGTIYVADAANRRLLRISDRVPEAILHTDAPYFPNGVATVGKDVYVLEIGFTLPNISSGPRVRKLTADGKQTILVTIGQPHQPELDRRSLAIAAGVTAENALVLVSKSGRWRYTIGVLSVGIVSVAFLIRRRKRRRLHE